MTSFTKALYNRDPAAADAYYRASNYERMMVQGRPGAITLACFTPSTEGYRPMFGKRKHTPRAGNACIETCGHPACAQGCTSQQPERRLHDAMQRLGTTASAYRSGK